MIGGWGLGGRGAKYFWFGQWINALEDLHVSGLAIDWFIINRLLLSFSRVRFIALFSYFLISCYISSGLSDLFPVAFSPSPLPSNRLFPFSCLFDLIIFFCFSAYFIRNSSVDAHWREHVHSSSFSVDLHLWPFLLVQSICNLMFCLTPFSYEFLLFFFYHICSAHLISCFPWLFIFWFVFFFFLRIDFLHCLYHAKSCPVYFSIHFL